MPIASESLLADSHAAVKQMLAPPANRKSRPPVIQLEDVTVEYSVSHEPIRTFKEYAIRLIQGRIRHDEFRALDSVSLEINQGEVFGIIGHNGAGKSTLLKVVSRVLNPTRGRIVVTGRVAPLLELGAGFHPELSGRENVFLNGTLLGFSHAEMESLFDGIVEFAELGDFIEAPLRTYSTGMGVRLGFAVATASRPDILIVDEVLAVGDEAFQEKCAARITEFRQSGTTVLLVTHDTRTVLGMCDRAVWLDHGRVGAVGAVEEVVAAYHDASQRGFRRQTARSVAKKAQVSKPAKSEPESSVSVTEARHLQSLAMEKNWFYPFELPDGRRTPCQLSAEVLKVHETRWQMLAASLEQLYGKDWSTLSCLDLGCNQGYFSVQLARRGCHRVVGFDARPVHVRDADLIRRIWGLENLRFRHQDLLKINLRDFEQFDVVLLFGMLYQFENPIGALRIARGLAKHALIVETQLAPDLTEPINWGAHNSFKNVEGSFAILDRSDEVDSPFGSLTPISLCPGREGLIWIMRKLGFTRVEELPLPTDAYEQFVSGKRVMIAGYL